MPDTCPASFYPAPATVETLAHAVGVAKRTIERLERNERSISAEPFEHMIVLLGALPDEVNYLATNPSATVEEARELARLLLQHGPSLDRSVADLGLHHEDPSTKGVQTYIRVLRERQGLSRKALADMIGIAIGVLADWEIGRTSAIPPQALVRAMTHLGATLENLEQIATASDDHEVLGRRLAEERIIATQACQASANGRSGPIVPPTPSVIAYRRKPYLEQQDPETGDSIQLPRRLPNPTWHKQTVVNICRQAVDGVYAGILNWGHRHNRFLEDADGNLKSPISVDTGRPLIPIDLLERVQVVERTPTDGPQRMSDFNSLLLSLRCGICGEAMHGYTSTKIGRSGKAYKYRKYRCAGRANNPGACRMPILSAEALEQVVIKAVFSDTAQRDGEGLHDEINTAIERHRAALLEALQILEDKLPALLQARNDALAAVMDRTLSATLKAAMVERAEQLVGEHQEAVAQQQMLRAALDSLTAKARSALAVLTDPNLDPSRWREPAVFAAFR